MRRKIKELSKNKFYVYAFIVFGIMVLLLGIKSAYAYYHDEQSFSILSALVGDFDGGSADINLIIYKQEKKGDENSYIKTYGVPEMGYSWNQQKTKCTLASGGEASCTYLQNDGTDSSGANCTYKYDSENRKFSVTSNQKLTCKFYFDKTEESDINVFLMLPDESGDKEYNNKQYRMVSHLPAFGYEFVENDNGVNNYKCYDLNGDTVTSNENNEAKVSYDKEKGKFVVETGKRTACYVYLTSVGSADIVTKVYVKNNGESNFQLVNSIPEGRNYQLAKENGVDKSKCKKTGVDTDEGEITNTITYDNGFIKIENIGEKVECEVYLEEQSNNVTP